jgi:hypothetical protein
MFQTLLDLQQISVCVVSVVYGRSQCVHTSLHREMEEVSTDLQTGIKKAIGTHCQMPVSILCVVHCRRNLVTLAYIQEWRDQN